MSHANPTGGKEEAGATKKKAATATTPAAKNKHPPPDDVAAEHHHPHSFPFVIQTLQKVFGYNWFKSFRLTMQAHLSGRAVVWSGPKETCEFKRDRVRSMGPDVHARRPTHLPLGCFIEPLPG